MSQTKVAAPFVANNANFRNLIINGDMSISQRTTSTTGVSTTGNFILDRWKCNVDNLGAFTISQSTDVPTGQGFSNSMKWDCTTADASPAADDNMTFQQRFEGQNLQMLKKGTSSAEKTTVSFWVKSNKTGTYVLELRDKDNSNRHINKTYTISSSDTWEKKTVTFDGDTTGTLTNDNSDSLDLNFWLGAGSTFSSGSLQTSWGSSTSANRAVGQVNLADSTSNEWYITGVQLEVGETATDFEHLPHDVQLDRCMRYCYVHNNDADSNQALIFPGATRGSTNKFFYIQHPRPMRDTPSITLSGEIRIINCTAGDQADADDTLAIGGVTPSIQGQNANEKGVTLAYTGAVTGITDTANTGYMMMFIKETNNKLTFDAEL